jgi:hypothetical protein
MRVKLQLVLCSDEGQEETVTEVITLNKNSQRIEHLGLTLAEANQLLSTLQRHLLQHQVDTFLGAYRAPLVAGGGRGLMRLPVQTCPGRCTVVVSSDRHGQTQGVTGRCSWRTP